MDFTTKNPIEISMNYQPHKIMGWNVDQNPEIASPNQLSNEKNPGWLGYIGDYTTQVYRDYFINQL